MLTQETTYTNKGTRSEARHGHLYINSKEVPDVFRLVVCGGTSYRFFSRKHIWGDDGYFAVPTDKTIKYFESNEKAGGEIFEKGYCKGRKRYSDVPATWIYVEYKGGEAFVDPLKLFMVISEINPDTILRTTEMQFRNR